MGFLSSNSLVDRETLTFYFPFWKSLHFQNKYPKLQKSKIVQFHTQCVFYMQLGYVFGLKKGRFYMFIVDMCSHLHNEYEQLESMVSALHAQYRQYFYFIPFIAIFKCGLYIALMHDIVNMSSNCHNNRKFPSMC